MRLSNLFVEFLHENHTNESDNKLSKRKKQRKSFTSCTIYTEGYKENTERKPVVSTKAILRTGETFSKEMGRRYSLSMALKQAFPGDWNRNRRREIWTAYWNRKPKKVPNVSI